MRKGVFHFKLNPRLLVCPNCEYRLVGDGFNYSKDGKLICEACAKECEEEIKLSKEMLVSLGDIK